MFTRPNRQNEIEIQLPDVELILGQEYPSLNEFLTSSFCRVCDGNSTVTKFKIFLDDTNDIIFEGECSKCCYPVARYIETGESRKSTEAAHHIRAIMKLKL